MDIVISIRLRSRFAGEFNKNVGRNISADTDCKGHAEMLPALNDLLKVVLNAFRFDMMDRIRNAMYA